MNSGEVSAASCPVAVVGMGLVVPGADSPSAYWGLHEIGIPQFSEPSERWNLAGYYSATDREDRSYAARLGFIHQHPDGVEGTRLGADRTVIWLRHSVKQSLVGVSRTDGDKFCFILGYTADGSHELLNALPKQSFTGEFGATFDQWFDTPGHSIIEPDRHLPHAVAREAMAGFLPETTELLVVDAACSSGLYAVDYGIRQVTAGRSTIAVCAGAFAIGWRDMILFSKLRGLSKGGDVRPMDRDADGVLFADGAAVVVIKELHRAREDGDTILGVITGSGVSCDGRGKAIYTPQAEGQRTAIKRAWQAAGVTAKQIDAVVAHATGTPLGDATELRGLVDLFADAGPVHVVSPKSIVGHTGWCAGIISLIHALLIMREGRIPPQHRFSELPEDLRPLGAILDIPTSWRNLPSRSDRPRAIGVSAFGFGGINAHLVLMDEHMSLQPISVSEAKRPVILLDWDAYLPGAPSKETVGRWIIGGRSGPPARFGDDLMKSNFAETRVPAATLAAMDPGQLMAVRASIRLRERLGELWDLNRGRIGVFGGHMGPSRNGVLYALRCALGFLEESAQEGKLKQLDTFVRYAAAVRNEIPPSSEDSYPGLMPNLVAARVANVLDARGLNLVIDTGSSSFLSTLKAAATYIEAGVIDFAIVLTVDANVTPEWSEIARQSEKLQGVELAEGVFAFLLGCRNVTGGDDRPAIGELVWDQGAGQAISGHGISRRRYLVGDQAIGLIRQLLTNSCPSIALNGQPTPAAAAMMQLQVLRHRVCLLELAPPDRPVSDAFIVAGSVVITNVRNPFGTRSLPGHLKIFSTDSRTPGATTVTDITENEIGAVMAALDWHPEHVRLVAELGGKSTIETGRPSELLAVSDLCFAAIKVLSENSGRPVSFSALLLNALDGGVPRPETGIFAGFAVALATEFSEMRVSLLATSEGDLDRALSLVCLEPPVRHSPEILYEDRGRWWSHAAVPAGVMRDSSASLQDIRVIVAAGGSRGITIPILLEIAKRHRPEIWLLGSQDLDSCPEWIFNGSDEAYDNARLPFIRNELGRKDGMTPALAAQKFRRYGDARQTRANFDRLVAFCGAGRVHYLACDVTDASATESTARLISQETPKVDLMLFAAGIERSAAVQRKKLDDFRRVRDTKVLGYANLKKAFASSQPRMWCNFGSVSGLMGGEGLVDYCAGNAYLGAAAQHAQYVQGLDEWTIGWPLWNEVGMGSEQGKLRWTPITPVDGIRFMLDELQQSKHDPYVAFLGRFERDRLAEMGVAIQSSDSTSRHHTPAKSCAPKCCEPKLLGRVRERSSNRLLFEASVYTDREPEFADHRIDGYPTMPAMLAVEIAAQAASQFTGGRRPTAIENVECLRFLRGKQSPGALIYRVDAYRPTGKEEDEERICVHISSDVVTPRGVRLAENVIHFKIDVVFGESEVADPTETTKMTGNAIEDPYYKTDANVLLSGVFVNTENLVSGPQGARASFLVKKFDGPSWSTYLTPLLLLDAAARTGVVAGARGDIPKISIITGVDRIALFTPKNDATLRAEHPERLILTAFATVPTGPDGSGKSRCIASTASGNYLANVEGVRYLAWKGRGVA